MKFTDRVAVGELKQTQEGYLVATARVARTGVQEYLASELGTIATDAGFKPNDIVRVLRHADEVFSQDSLNTITRLPVTVDHPPEDVTAANWAEYSVGEVGDAYSTESTWVVVNPMIKDARGVKAAQTTHKEISMGYRAEIVPARDTKIADFEQRNIRFNHLSLVPRGRAGAQARIGDAWGAEPLNDNEPPPTGSKPKPAKGGHMTTKTVVLGDKAVQVLVEDAAQVEQFKTDSAKALADAEKTHEAAVAAKDAELAKLQAKLDDAESKILSDADLDAKVAGRAALVAVAGKIAPDVKTQGVKDADIRKAVVAAKLGDEAVADRSEAYIDARFEILAEDSAKEENPVRDALKQAYSGNNVSARDAYMQRIFNGGKAAQEV